MDQSSARTLGQLNPYQVAGLAIVTSAVAAISVLFIMRRFVFRTPVLSREGLGNGEQADVEPAVSTEAPVDTPNHFSEDIIIPGKTATGTEIAQQDAEEGRSPEGV